MNAVDATLRFGPPALAQALAVQALGCGPTVAPAPRLALVIGSGGVKSIAALGLAEVLYDEGIQPDCFAGCSAGAGFGALLASGMSPTAAIAAATRLWSADVTRRRRRTAWAELLWSALSPAGHPGFAERFGLRDDRLMLQRLHAAFGERRIEQSPLALAVMATDALTGEPVLLREGRIVDALRASMALPFLFAPHRVDGQWLIDGSVCDPLPVCAVVGARTVLAMGFPVPLPRQVSGPTRLATRITASLTNNLLAARLQAYPQPQRLLTLLPTLPRRIGLFETAAMPLLLDIGRQAARQALPRLRRLLQDDGCDQADAAWEAAA